MIDIPFYFIFQTQGFVKHFLKFRIFVRVTDSQNRKNLEGFISYFVSCSGFTLILEPHADQCFTFCWYSLALPHAGDFVGQTVNVKNQFQS